MNQNILTETRGLLRPRGGEDRGGPAGASVRAEVHHEDPDAIRVVEKEPVAVPEAEAAAIRVEIPVLPPKPRCLGWIRRGPKRYQLRTVAEEKRRAQSECMLIKRH